MKKTRFYVTLTWDDFPEGGSYGTVVHAADHHMAEALARQEMADHRADPDRTADEIFAAYHDEWHLIDCFDLDEFIESHKCVS